MADDTTLAERLAAMIAARRQLHTLADQRRLLLLANRLVPEVLLQAIHAERLRLVMLKKEITTHADV